MTRIPRWRLVCRVDGCDERTYKRKGQKVPELWCYVHYQQAQRGCATSIAGPTVREADSAWSPPVLLAFKFGKPH